MSRVDIEGEVSKMGTTQAMGFAEAVSEGELPIEAALSWHLTANHYPPLSTDLIAPAIQAIMFGNEGQWDAPVALPEGTTWRGNPWAPAWAAIEGWHLDAFLDPEVL